MFKIKQLTSGRAEHKHSYSGTRAGIIHAPALKLSLRSRILKLSLDLQTLFRIRTAYLTVVIAHLLLFMN